MNSSTGPLRYFIVVGSHRPVSMSAKVARFLEASLRQREPGCEVHLLDLGAHPVPFYDDDMKEEDAVWRETWIPNRAKLREADAVIVVAPEWGGMAPAAIKNFFLLCGPKELGHKPATLVAVTSGIAGMYPIAELRMSSFKNNKVCYTPDHVVVRYVERVLNGAPGDEPASKEDDLTRRRIKQALNTLQVYAHAFRGIRSAEVIRNAEFGNGM